jgi:pantothenate kinase
MPAEKRQRKSTNTKNRQGNNENHKDKTIIATPGQPGTGTEIYKIQFTGTTENGIVRT